MNSTHYLNGTEVPTQAPIITNGTIGADPTGDDPNNPFGLYNFIIYNYFPKKFNFSKI